MLLADNINRLIQDKNISNVQLGKEIGIGDETIRKWRNGQTIPPIDKAKLLANYFHISLDSLMGEPIYTEQMVDLPLIGVVSAGIFTIE